METKYLPNHVAIIMDGNGRWAQKRGLPRNYGHKKGAQRLLNLVKYANKLNIKYLTVFAFSTENWKRPEQEVNYLLKLPFEFLNKIDKEFNNLDIKVSIVGFRNNLPQEVIDKIDEIEAKTRDNKGLHFTVAFNYGSQDEIINTVNYLVDNNIKVTKENFSKYLLTKELPDVDLLIRTSGEYRISNFLLWQIAYSELYFTDVLWPDFSNKHFDKSLEEYRKRDRRFGGLK